MPSLEMVTFLVGEIDLPKLDFSASGHVASEASLIRLRDVQVQLGSSSFRLDGGISNQESLSGSFLSIDASGPKLAELLDFPELQSLPQDFSIDGRWQRTDTEDVISELRLSLGSLTASIDGTVDNLFAPVQLNLMVQANGPDASVLNELTGQPLAAEAFELSTRFEGSFDSFNLENLKAELGAYSVAGDLIITLADPPGISGQLSSGFLDASPWITWQSEEDSASLESIPPPASNFFFTDEPLPTIDASPIPIDLHVTIDEVSLGEVTLKNMRFDVSMDDRLLLLDSLYVEGMHSDTITGSIELDGSGVVPVWVVKIQTDDFRLGLVAGQSLDTVPPADLFLDITGSGSTYRQLVSSLNGRIRLQLGAGQIANIDRNIILSDVIRELILALNPFRAGRAATNLECAIIVADIVSGRATLNPVIVQTENVTILSNGSIDLRSENINLEFNSRERTGIGISAGMVVNPFIKLGGRLSAPNLELDPSSAVVFGGLAVATGGFSLLARSLADRYFRDNDPCATAVEEIMLRDAEGN